MEKSNEKENLKFRKIVLIVMILCMIYLTMMVVYNKIKNKGAIYTNGINLQYRVYTEDGWSRYYKNGQIVGNDNKKILAIEAKVISETKGNIYYNTYGVDNTFEDNDDYNGATSGDKKNNIYAVKFGLSDKLYKKYKIYYRTYNKLDGWLDWANINEISGNNEVNIEKIQIKILDNKTLLDGSTKNPSKGFKEGA